MSATAAVTLPEIMEMRNVDVRRVERSSLRDVLETSVRTELPRPERMMDFIRQIGNPYCFRYKQYVVKIGYRKSDKTLQELMLDCVRENCARRNF
jgi:hypothetical protein